MCSTPARQLLDTSYLSRFKKETEILICFLGISECVFGTSFLLRAVKVFTSYTSIEQSLFKQIVTGDKVLPQFIVLEEVALYVHHRVL